MAKNIHQKNPKGPMIEVENASSGEIVQRGNMVVIDGPSTVRFDPRGLPNKDYVIKAWIEAEEEDVTAR